MRWAKKATARKARRAARKICADTQMVICRAGHSGQLTN